MGVYDFINSTTDKLKQNAPDLTPVGNACRTSYHYSGAAVSKLNYPPDLTPVKKACLSSYDYSCSAVSKVHNAARVDRLWNLTRYWPDDVTRAKIALFATKFTQNAADYAFHEGVKCIPGGVAVSKIVSKTLHDVKKSEHHKNEAVKKGLLQLQANAACRPEQDSSRKSFEQAEMLKRDVKFGSPNTHEHEKPEDVLRMFMMTEFVGCFILDDFLVRESRRREKNQKG